MAKGQHLKQGLKPDKFETTSHSLNIDCGGELSPVEVNYHKNISTQKKQFPVQSQGVLNNKGLHDFWQAVSKYSTPIFSASNNRLAEKYPNSTPDLADNNDKSTRSKRV